MDETQARELGAYLREERERTGMSVRGLAAQVGIDQAQILRLEAGKVAGPRADILGQIADVLGVPIADVFSLAGYPTTRTLPNLIPYLRTKYSGLSPEAMTEIQAVISREMNLQTADGPINREDEEDPSPEGTRR